MENYSFMRPALLIVSFVLFLSPAFGQSLADSSYLDLLEEGIALKEDWKIDEGIRKIEQAARYFASQGHTELYLHSQLEIAHACINKGRVDKEHSRELIDQATDILVSVNETMNKREIISPRLRADWLFYNGRLQELNYGNPDEGINLMKEALAMYKKYDPEAVERISRISIQLGESYHYSKTNLDSAEKYLWEGLITRENNPELKDYLLAKAYLNISIVYRKLSKDELSRDLALQAALLTKNRNWPRRFLITCQIGYINSMSGTGKHVAAIEACKYYLASDDLEPEDRINFQYELGRIHFLNKDYEQAIEILTALAERIKRSNSRSIRYSQAYIIIALCYQELGDLYKALEFLDLADRIMSRSSVENNQDLVKYYYDNKSHVFIELNAFDSALLYIQRSMGRDIPELDIHNIYANPQVDQIADNPSLVTAIKKKAEVLKDRFLYQSHDLNDLKSALSASLIADSLLLKESYSMVGETNWIDRANSGRLQLSRTLDICSELYKTTRDEYYLNIAFHFMDQLKASAMSQYRRLAAEEFDQELQEMIRRSRELEYGILNIRRQLYQERLQNPLNLDYNINQEMWDRLRRTNLELLGLEKKIEKRLKEVQTDFSTITIAEIQDNHIKKDELVISYFQENDLLYVIAFSTDHIEFDRIELDAKTLSLIEEFSQATLNYQYTSAARFENIGLQLYNKLLAPFLDKKSSEHDYRRVYVLSHGVVQSLPLDALVYDLQENKKSFQSLHYVLDKYSISYGFKANLLFNQNIEDFHYLKKARLLAMSYSSPITMEMVEQRKSMTELPGSYEEIRNILKIHKGKEVSGARASEAFFKDQSDNYDLIHLAIHGYADTINMLNTKLVFRQEADSVEDGNLYAYELYNMNLKARLVALSACESGKGQYQSGEGSYSMARAFAIAGVPTIVTSLCEVQDRTTSEIMQSFYNRVLNGDEVDNSLRQAKLDFIHSRLSSNQAHPSNWAAFICIGDPQPIYSDYNHYLYGLGVFILLAFAGIFGYKKSRKS